MKDLSKISVVLPSLDPDEKLGLRILGGMASNIRYVHTLETNNVILKFPVAKADA